MKAAVAATSPALLLAVLVLGAGAQEREQPKLAFGTCMKLGPRIVGEPPVKASGKVAPKKVRHVAPSFPELPSGTSLSGGAWIGEVLIDGTGAVVRIWPLREFHLTPAFPLFNEAVVDAIRDWQFTPLIVKGHATPVCMTVTTLVNIP